jgi:hypothetical protein
MYLTSPRILPGAFFFCDYFRVSAINGCEGRPHGPAGDQPQENPDLEEQPDRAPAGIEERPEEIRKLEAEMVFLTLRLPHLLHSISCPAAEALPISTSKFALQSLHLYS